MGRKPNSGTIRKSTRYGHSARFIVVLGSALIACELLYITQFQPAILWDHLKTRLFPTPATISAKTPLAAPIGVVEPPPMGTDSSISKSPIKLVLVATHPGRNAREGFALIGVNVRSPQTYGAGALLANGARVQEIYKDYVVLERAGQTAQLHVTGREPANYDPTFASMMSIGGVVSPEVAHADSGDRLTEVIRMSPAFDGKSFAGLKVFPNAQSDVFFRLGLQEADIITVIDGAPLKDQKSAIAALRPLVTGQALTAVVKRGNQFQTIALNGSSMF